MTKEELTAYIIAACKLREEARTAVLHASKEMESVARLITAYSGQDLVLRAHPTEAFR